MSDWRKIGNKNRTAKNNVMNIKNITTKNLNFNNVGVSGTAIEIKSELIFDDTIFIKDISASKPNSLDIYEKNIEVLNDATIDKNLTVDGNFIFKHGTKDEDLSDTMTRLYEAYKSLFNSGDLVYNVSDGGEFHLGKIKNGNDFSFVKLDHVYYTLPDGSYTKL